MSRGELRLPLPGVYASTIGALVCSEGIEGHDGKAAKATIVQVKDLCHPAFVEQLNATERFQLTNALRVHLRRMMVEGALPPAILGLELNWTGHFMSLVGRPARLTLRDLGWADRVDEVRLSELVVHLGDDVAALVRLIARARVPGSSADFVAPPVLVQTLESSPSNCDSMLEAQGNLPILWDAAPNRPWRAAVIERSIALPDGSCLTTSDPRFGDALQQLIKAAGAQTETLDGLLTQLAASSLSEPTRSAREALLSGLRHAEEMSVEDEIRDVLTGALRAAKTRDRSVRMVMARYGCDGQQRTLDDVGTLFGITRMSVLSAVQLARKHISEDCHAPACRSLALRVHDLKGSLAETQLNLNHLLGPTQDLLGALQFTADFIDSAVSTPWVEFRSARPSKKPVAETTSPREDLVETQPQASPAEGLEVARIARKISARDGACHWAAVAGWAAEALQSFVSRSACASAIGDCQDALWLDEVSGWAVVGDMRNSPWSEFVCRMLRSESSRALTSAELFESCIKNGCQLTQPKYLGKEVQAMPFFVFEQWLSHHPDVAQCDGGHRWISDPAVEAEADGPPAFGGDPEHLPS